MGKMTCDGCGKLFLFKPKELSRDSDRDGPYVTFKCPRCGKVNYVHADVWDGPRG